MLGNVYDTGEWGQWTRKWFEYSCCRVIGRLRMHLYLWILASIYGEGKREGGGEELGRALSSIGLAMAE